MGLVFISNFFSKIKGLFSEFINADFVDMNCRCDKVIKASRYFGFPIRPVSSNYSSTQVTEIINKKATN